MKAVSEDKLRAFLEIGSGAGWGAGWGDGSGAGSGDGSGAGWGDGWGAGWGAGWGDGSGAGWGDGSGAGWGDGSGAGWGDGWGAGWGDGCGITFFCGMSVHMIDDVATIITAILGNSAKGYILESDLTLSPCYVAKAGRYFAHGETLEEAVHDVREKLYDDMDEDEVIAEFWKCHARGVKYPARDFYNWHHRLTGSCRMGRDSFVSSHGIDLDGGMYTVDEFVAITRGSYGGAVIARLAGDADV